MNGIVRAVEFDLETTASPEKVRTALIDFSERRPQLWSGIEPTLNEVYTRSVTPPRTCARATRFGAGRSGRASTTTGLTRTPCPGRSRRATSARRAATWRPGPTRTRPWQHRPHHLGPHRQHRAGATDLQDASCLQRQTGRCIIQARSGGTREGLGQTSPRVQPDKLAPAGFTDATSSSSNQGESPL
jgi:hypothetical protein